VPHSPADRHGRGIHGSTHPRGPRDPPQEAGLPAPTREDFEQLLAFRVSLRRFQHWSEAQARAAGLTHVQHQLLVAVKGHAGDAPPAVGDLAGYLLVRHHSAVELVDRAEAAGLVRRAPDPQDARIVRVRLTPKGDHPVTALTNAHLAELHHLAAALAGLGPASQRPAAGYAAAQALVSLAAGQGPAR
jgi:DNA-binding MarR family transcriptional regulator